MSNGSSRLLVLLLIGTVTIFGDTDVELNTTHAYSITTTGNAQDTTVVYTTDNPTDVISGGSITFNSSGTTTVTATVTSPTATDSPQTATYVVSVLILHNNWYGHYLW